MIFPEFFSGKILENSGISSFFSKKNSGKGGGFCPFVGYRVSHFALQTGEKCCPSLPRGLSIFAFCVSNRAKSCPLLPREFLVGYRFSHFALETGENAAHFCPGSFWLVIDFHILC